MNASIRYLKVILAGVHMGTVVAVAYTVLNAVNPAGVGLQQAATWGLTYCGQLVCARVGGTTGLVWGVVAAVVAGESWRPFGQAFGGAVMATCSAIAGGFVVAYVTAMMPQWQGPYFPGGLAAYLIQVLEYYQASTAPPTLGDNLDKRKRTTDKYKEGRERGCLSSFYRAIATTQHHT